MSAGPPNSSPPPGADSLWGSHSGSGAPVPPSGAARTASPSGGDQIDPLSRRLLHIAGVLSVLLLLVLANSLLNSGGGEGPLELNPVAAAAERTENCPGARFSMYIVYSSPALPQTITATGSGAVNTKTDRSRVTIEMDSPVTGPVRIVEIEDGDYEYTGGDTVAKQLPPGKEWVRTESGVTEDDELELDSDEALGMLTNSSEVQLVGREPINGKMTRRYRAEVQLGEVIDYLQAKGDDEAAEAYERIEEQSPVAISAEGWVDGKNLLRRFRIVTPSPGEPGEPALMVDMRMDFFDYGAEPVIQIPDPDSVIEGPLDEDSAVSGSIA